MAHNMMHVYLHAHSFFPSKDERGGEKYDEEKELV
jgi:hypothetical protein